MSRLLHDLSTSTKQRNCLSAGLSIRADLSDLNSSALGFVGITGHNSLIASRLISTNSPLPVWQVPVWFKLAKIGSSVAGFVSKDGSNWELAELSSLRGATNAYAGFFASSGERAVLATGVFDK